MSQAREYVGTVVGEGGAELPVWYEPTADDWASYEQYLDSLPESLPTPEDDAGDFEDAETSAARVAAWLERNGLDAAPF